MTANTVGLLIAYLLYTPIAHGLTGTHPRGLDAAQIASHSLALAIVAVSVAAAQRHVLRRYVSVPRTRLLLAAIAFIAAFWFGYYQPWLRGPDFDILFGSFVLGNAAILGIVPMQKHRLAAAVVLSSFPFACFVGQLVTVTTVLSLGIVPGYRRAISSTASIGSRSLGRWE
jgi:hypothetical protein